MDTNCCSHFKRAEAEACAEEGGGLLTVGWRGGLFMAVGVMERWKTLGNHKESPVCAMDVPRTFYFLVTV